MANSNNYILATFPTQVEKTHLELRNAGRLDHLCELQLGYG
jgi:hypothetical protein